MKKILLLSLLITQPTLAEYINNDIIGGCNGIYGYRAVLVPKQITCSSGYYLPANTLSCELCPSGYTCNGGTYDFNADNFSGATYSTPITNNMNKICAGNASTGYRAVFQPKSITCDAGKYLSANSIVCNQTCPANSKCPGGIYTFNETTNQGIEPCPSNTPHAPTGSAVCYPHIMHLSSERPNDVIYLKSTATTTPAFNINIDGTTYYANMTTTQTYMTSISEHYLKITVDGVLYYVCDDTICLGAE